MNGYLWTIQIVPYDSSELIDTSGRRSVATTDWTNRTVNLSDELRGKFRTRVFIHELGHCALFSFGLINEIRRFVYPEYWIDAEEWICNFLADYGMEIYNVASSYLGDNGWMCIPKELERLIA